MTIRVGVINRHEDVHGISGEGDHKAEVVEFSDGSVVVRWLGKDAMTNVAAGIKNVTNVHGHGGKTEVEWLWESPPAPDPMEAVFEKKIIEAGGSTGQTLTTGSTARLKDEFLRVVEADEEAAKDAEADAMAEEIVEDAAETVERVSEKVAEKLKEKVAEKTAEKVAQKAEDAPE